MTEKDSGKFRICLLNSAANSAQSRCKLAGLAVLFSRQLLKDFFCFNILIIIYFFKYEIIETHAQTYLSLKISAVDSVKKVADLMNKLLSHTVARWKNPDYKLQSLS